MGCGELCVLLLGMGQAGRAAEHSLTIKDNLGRPWVSEPICWEMPATTADKVLVTRDGTPIAAQVVATAGGVHVLLLIDKLAKDAASQDVKDAIAADIKEAEGFKFEGTPGFLLNGVPIRGAYPVEHFDEIIQKLQAAKGAK